MSTRIGIQLVAAGIFCGFFLSFCGSRAVNLSRAALCAKDRPVVSQPAPLKPVATNPGDWICTPTGVRFPESFEAFVCVHPKPERDA